MSDMTPTQTEVLRLWREAGVGQTIPHREDLDPGAMRAHLASLSIVQIEQDGQVRFRLFGSALRSLAGRDFKGCRLVDLPEPQSDLMMQGLNIVLERSEPAVGVSDCGKVRHAWMRLPLYSARGETLILCHDEMLPSARGRGEESDTISHSVSHNWPSLAA